MIIINIFFQEINFNEGKYKKQYPNTCTHYCIMTMLNYFNYNIDNQLDLLKDFKLSVLNKYKEDFPEEYRQYITFNNEKNELPILNFEEFFLKNCYNINCEYRNRYSEFLCSKEEIQMNLDKGNFIMLGIKPKVLLKTTDDDNIKHLTIITSYDDKGFNVLIPHEIKSYIDHFKYNDIYDASFCYYIFSKKDIININIDKFNI